MYVRLSYMLMFVVIIGADVTDLEQCLVDAFTELFSRRYKKK